MEIAARDVPDPALSPETLESTRLGPKAETEATDPTDEGRTVKGEKKQS